MEHAGGRDDPRPVTGPAVLVLGDEPAAAGRARRWAAHQVMSAGLDELSDDIELIVGELVANALFHAGPPAEVVVHVEPPQARVEVRDRSPIVPVRAPPGDETMTGRGLRIIEALARAWGVERSGEGKCIWVELKAGATTAERTPAAAPSEDEIDALVEAWAAHDEAVTGRTAVAGRYLVQLPAVPTDLLLAAKAHVDDLVREFTLAASGARSGTTEEVPRHLAKLLEAVVERFAEPRQLIKRQAVAAANAGAEHVTLELSLPFEAAEAGERYLEALDEADAYCRAARLLTLETPPQQRVFRRWYVEELIAQLRGAAAGEAPTVGQTFEQRLLAEIDAVAAAERTAERSARLTGLSAALAGAATPEEVADRVLNEGVAAMSASGGGLLLVTGEETLAVPGTVGYDESVVAGLRAEPPDAALPAAYAARTGEAVWLESRRERDERYPALGGLEPRTISMCALPLVAADRVLGALRFSFSRARLFDDEERAFALNLAAQTAQALDRALLQHRQGETLRRLQRTLLPQDLPAVAGVDLAARHEPAEPDAISGDFYDVLGTDAGLTLVVGDVHATGIEAASLTAMARHTVRSGALTGLGPARILDLLNAALLRAQVPDHTCTAVCARLVMGTGGARLTVACGGHPEPLVLRAGGAVERVPCEGGVVGASAAARYTAMTVRLDPGDLVLLYTDGISEAHAGGLPFGREALEHELAAGRGAPAATVVEQVAAAAATHAAGPPDDRAMLAVRLLPPTERAQA